MGVDLPKGASMAGFRLAQVKQALKAWARTGREENFFEIGSFAPSRMEAAVLYEELLERKLLDPEAKSRENHLTEAGKAIASGKTRRSPLPAALRVLEDLLARVEGMNADPTSLKLVERVWLFGSVMREQETVGDIDLAIELTFNPAYGDSEARSARMHELAKAAPHHLPYYKVFSWYEERALFGARRHPLLAGAQIDAENLKELGVPCRLIFDRSRGGRVEDAVISRHPASPGRSNSISAPRELPDLAPLAATPRPMDARWMSGYRDDGRISPRRLFSREIKASGPGSHVLTDQAWFQEEAWRPSSLKGGGYDGASRVLLKHHDSWRDPQAREAASMALHRSIRTSGAQVELRVELSDYERPRRMKPQLDSAFLHLCGMAALLICGDLHRQTLRLRERGEDRAVALDLDATRLPEELRTAAPIWIQHFLQDLQQPDMGEGP